MDDKTLEGCDIMTVVDLTGLQTKKHRKRPTVETRKVSALHEYTLHKTRILTVTYLPTVLIYCVQITHLAAVSPS